MPIPVAVGDRVDVLVVAKGQETKTVLENAEVAAADKESGIVTFLLSPGDAAKVTDAEHPFAVTAYPLDGGPSLRLCNWYCVGRWDISEKFFFLTLPESGDLNTYMLPVSTARGIPNFPAGGITTGADLKADKRVLVIPQQIESAAGPNHYSYTRQNTRRNIYRIPLPE